MKSLRFDVRVRNNRLVTAREELGLTQRAAAEAADVHLSLLGGLETCRDQAMQVATGEWREVAVTIATFYGYSPEYLWPEEVRALKKRAATLFVDAGDIARLLDASPSPERQLLLGSEASRIRSVLKALTPREEEVLRQRFGIDRKSDHSREEIGKGFEVGRERIRQIEAKALRKLRHPKIRRPLVEAMVEAPADQWTCGDCGRLVERAAVCGNCGEVDPRLDQAL